MEPRFFKNAAELRRWLERNHDKKTEVFVGLYKKGTGKPSVTWEELVDVALCFGWIDGIVRRIDDESRVQRLTPRRKGSTWSARNIARVKALTEQGLMHPAGLAAFERRDPKKTNLYSSEQRNVKLPPVFAKRLKANKKAAAFWDAQPPGYKKVTTWWVVSAKKDETKERRFQSLLDHCARGERIPQF